jgi:hypothetical protein
MRFHLSILQARGQSSRVLRNNLASKSRLDKAGAAQLQRVQGRGCDECEKELIQAGGKQICR